MVIAFNDKRGVVSSSSVLMEKVTSIFSAILKSSELCVDRERGEGVGILLHQKFSF